MTDLERLLAIEDIRNLRARYTRFIDTKQWDQLAGILSRDITLDLPSLRAQGGLRGVEAFISLVKSWFAASPSLHMNYLPEIEVLSERSARGIWGQEYFLPPAFRRGEFHGHGYGYSHETYEKVGGAWLMASVRLEPTFHID